MSRPSSRLNVFKAMAHLRMAIEFLEEECQTGEPTIHELRDQMTVIADSRIKLKTYFDKEVPSVTEDRS